MFWKSKVTMLCKLVFRRLNMDHKLACINEYLPEESLTKIFNYLDVKSRLLYLPAVCRKWCASVNFFDTKECNIFDLHDELCQLDFDCPLRKSLASNSSQLDGDNPLQDIWLCKFTSRCLAKMASGLKILSFQTKVHQSVLLHSSVVVRIELMEIVLRFCPKIEELNFLRCHVSQEAADMLNLFGRLKCLRINSQQVLDKVWPDLCLTLDNFESRVNLGQSFVKNRLDDEGGAKSYVLKRLTLHADLSSENNFTALPLDILIEGYPNLTELNIQSCKLGGSILSAISELRFLEKLSFMVTETTSPQVLDRISQRCTNLKDLTIIDRYSNGALNFDLLAENHGSSLKYFALNSSHNISAMQLRAIKNFRSLKQLILRTNKLPVAENAAEKSNCCFLEELSISASNFEEKSLQHKIFLVGSSAGFSKLGYLPRGWSLHATDGLEPKMLAEYFDDPNNGQKAEKLVKVIFYATDSLALKQLLGKHSFSNLTGLIIFGDCELDDEICAKIAPCCPRLSYALTESHVKISPAGIAKILEAHSLQEAHFKYQNLEADGTFCVAIGGHAKLKYVAFRGMLMPNKMKLRSEHWDKIMEGRLEIFRAGLTCERLFIDCFYEKRSWPRKLACALRKLWISCRAMKVIEDEQQKPVDDVM